MGTVQVKFWNFHCVGCGWKQHVMMAATKGRVDAKRFAIENHYAAQYQCPTGDVGVEVEEER